MTDFLPRFKARRFLDFSIDQLWDVVKGRFILVFDDCVEMEVTGKDTLYSTYFWELHRQYPNTPLLPHHHVKSVLKGKYLTSRTHINLLSNISQDVFTTYQINTPHEKATVTEKIYRIIDKIYGDLSYRTEAHASSIDILDFLQVTEHPVIQESLSSLRPTQNSIDKHYRAIMDLLEKDTSFNNNALALSSKAGLSNKNQILQCVGPRGFLTDVDSVIFKQPVLRGYTQGFRTLYDSAVESRSSSKALFFSESPLEDSEYFARRLQILAMTVENIHYGDCGSTSYLDWIVKGPSFDERGQITYQGDLKFMVGKYYLNTDGVLKDLKESDTHLIGTKIKIRSPVAGCNHPDQHGICSVCFGRMYENLPENFNAGHICAATMTQQTTQLVLSTKHYDGSSDIEPLILDEISSLFFVVGNDKNSYYLRNDILKEGRCIKLHVSIDNVQSLMELTTLDDVQRISINRVSDIEHIKMTVEENGQMITYPINISFNGRNGMMSRDFLLYVFEHKFEPDNKKFFGFDLSHWDASKPLFILPYKHFNMADHTLAISQLVELSVEKITSMEEEGESNCPNLALQQLFDVVNSKLNVNLAVLEIIMLSVMVRDFVNDDYRLPKGYTSKQLSAANRNISRRSFGALYAYEGQCSHIVNPLSFFKGTRIDHPMDAFITPYEVMRDK